MANAGLKTKVDKEYFGDCVRIEKELAAGPQYAYKVSKNSVPYIIKGYQISLEYLDCESKESRRRFLKTLQQIAEVHQEYFFLKLISTFSQHFPKSLAIDYEVDNPSDNSDLPYLYIEILLEYIGEPLKDVKSFDVDVAYNLMRQSASVIALLSAIGICHLEINPSNMFFNEVTNLLKIIALTGHNDYLLEDTGKREIATSEFSPPELLQKTANPSVSGEAKERASVYSWAMSFYALILRKNRVKLENEVARYKLSTQETYDGFISSFRAAMKSLVTSKGSQKQFVEERLCEALSFKPENRPSISVVVSQMKGFEQRSKMEMRYLEQEREHSKVLRRIFMLEAESENRGGRTFDAVLGKISEKIAESARIEKTLKSHKEGLMQLQRDIRASNSVPEVIEIDSPGESENESLPNEVLSRNNLLQGSYKKVNESKQLKKEIHAQNESFHKSMQSDMHDDIVEAVSQPPLAQREEAKRPNNARTGSPVRIDDVNPDANSRVPRNLESMEVDSAEKASSLFKQRVKPQSEDMPIIEHIDKLNKALDNSLLNDKLSIDNEEVKEGVHNKTASKQTPAKLPRTGKRGRPRGAVNQKSKASNVYCAKDIREYGKTKFSSNGCQGCARGENTKAFLACSHSICSACLDKYMIQKMLSDEEYNYCAYCVTCKKVAEIGSDLVKL